jgi:LEA14-like dessication related protein
MNELLMSEVELVSGGSRAWVNIVPDSNGGVTLAFHFNPDLDNRVFGTDTKKQDRSNINPNM